VRVLVTAGGTREPIDDVRVLANTSTGRLGARLADALAAAGHDTLLLHGPGMQSVYFPAAGPVRLVPVSADELVVDDDGGYHLRIERREGRVVGVTGLGDDLAEAAKRSREGAARVRFEGAAWRSDIGHSEIDPDAD